MNELFKDKRILFISYTSFLQEFYQTLPHQIALQSGAQVQVLVPEYWREIWSGGKIYLEKTSDPYYKLSTGTVAFNGNLHFAFFINALKKILIEFNPDIIDLENEPFNAGSFQIFKYRDKYSPKSKIVLHASQHQFKRYPFPFNFIEKQVLKNVDAILVRNSMAKDVLNRKGYSGILEIMTHGVDTSAFKPDKTKKGLYKLNPDYKPLIGYVGALAEHKGLTYLLKAVKGLKCKVILIGDGPEKHLLKNLANQLKLDVDFIPPKKHEEVAEYMNSMDIFVLPSLTRSNWVEKFGRVLIEAMACGIPVIGSSSGEIPNVLGDAGIIVPEGNAKELNQRIKELIENPESRQHFSKKGRQRVVRKYSWKIIAKQTIDIYQRILQRE